MSFVLDRATFDRLIERYEALRASAGMGTLLTRVTPGQRSDALALCHAVRAAGGVPDGDQRAFWLPYLQPVLAETRQQAAALAEALASLPEGPEAPSGPVLPDRVQPKAGRLPIAGAGTGGENEKRRGRLTGRHLAIGVAIAVLLAVAALVFHRWSPTPGPGESPRQSGRAGGSVPTPFATPAPEALGPGGDGGLRAARYRQMLHVALAAAHQHENQISPYALAAHLSAQVPELGGPSAVLARMLQAYPLPPLAPIPNTPFGAMALRGYAAQAAAVRYAESPASFQAFLGDDARFAGSALAGDIGAFATFRPATAFPAAAPRWETWPPWFALAPFLVLLPGAAWAFWGLGALRRRVIAERLSAAMQARHGRRHPDAKDLGERATFSTTAGLPPLPDATRTVRRLLKLREARPGFRMDVARSLRATLASGGDLVTVMRPASRTVDFLFLVRRDQRHDHERARVLRLLNVLSEAGVALVAYDYTGDPRHLTATARVAAGEARRPTRSLDLRGLRDLYPEAVLVLMTDGEDLFEPFGGQPCAFVGAALKLWRRRMLLTPVPVAEWGHHEARLAAVLDAPLGRSTMAGLADLGLALAPGAERAGSRSFEGGAVVRWRAAATARIAPDPALDRPRALVVDPQALVRDRAPVQAVIESTLIALRNWLGPGFLWFAACGVHPQLRFDLTLWLGARLRRFGYPNNAPLFNEALLDRLCLLPWFRLGYMPDWLRIAAFAALTPREQAMARGAIEALLSRENRVHGASRSAAVTIGLPVWQADWRREELMADGVMLDCVFGEPDKVETRPAIREAAAAEAHRVWLRRALLRLAWFFAWAAIAAFLWPAPSAAPHAGGAWWPFAVFVVLGAALTLAAAATATRDIGRAFVERGLSLGKRRRAESDDERPAAKV